jgi:hypothetical protein
MQRYSNPSDGEVFLTGRLAEFRTALLQEIDAASRQETSSSVMLTNGRRIGQLGGSFQYVFDIENALNLPGDAPGDLFVPGRQSIQVTIVAVDGMLITLAVSEDLGPGVPSACLKSNLTMLMRQLIGRIEERAETANVIGDRILEGHAHGEPANVEFTGFALNQEQSEAVRASLGFDVTFIQGPPGTGKTWTIGAIALELLRTKRSVLLVSHTNIAVDQALLKMAKYIATEEQESGAVVRVGEHKDAQLSEYPNLLLSTHVEKRSKALVDHRIELEHARDCAVKDVKNLCTSIELCEWVSQAKDDVDQMRDTLANLHEKDVESERLADVFSQLQSHGEYWSAAKIAAQTTSEGHRDLARAKT